MSREKKPQPHFHRQHLNTSIPSPSPTATQQHPTSFHPPTYPRLFYQPETYPSDDPPPRLSRQEHVRNANIHVPADPTHTRCKRLLHRTIQYSQTDMKNVQRCSKA
ncbi:hypothetical protein BU25DRAFT_420654 [Macroventuria anomochaeta]|uniref:Uncharacterized protein n=1 Tax=Macroventuria anomochaeta TaxID=301207 RepID=A0ACB6S3F7_9PLEO|nr:uncharacterized protein BU25DRAFT_420654 [Macroventuria anomochaeta]KAF2628696.1 hypothetical protein BU25DRAFT_420654 [Macroventuria anomochaeta]